MRKSEAAKYARWSAAAALLCASLTLGVYLKRGWTRYNERKNAPPPPAVNVERQSTKLTFSKGEGVRTVFTVEALKSTDFKGLNATDLEGVKVTIFGKDGTRHDTLETHACRYSKDSGDIDCAGDVEITLMSKVEWEAARVQGAAPGAAAAMKVETRGMVFNRASGEAKTAEEVRFTFTNGSGQAVGATYHSEEGTLTLLHNVRLELDQPVPARGKDRTRGPAMTGKEPVEVTGSRMEFQRDAGTMYLAGPAEAKTTRERLTAAGLQLNLDENFHAKRLIAKGNGKDMLPEFTSEKGAGRQRLSAEEILANFTPEGWVTSAEAKGRVSGESVQGDETQTVKAQSASMEMISGINAPKLLVLKGDVDARTNTSEKIAHDRSPARKNGVGGAQEGASARRLTTEELRIAFAEKYGASGTRLQSAETAGTGRVELNDAANASSKAARTVLQANQLSMRFDAEGAASRLDAKGSVQTERTVAGGSKQTATANNGFVEMQPRGGWSRMELSENVQMNEAQRTARADHAVFVRAEQTATLSGHAIARDATSQTSAQKLTFWQATGDVRGEGNVRSSDLSARSTTVHLAPAASNISADNVTGNSKTGRALYTGHARLWQGDSVLEAESIELLKSERMLNAAGNVRAVFPQAAGGANSAQGKSKAAGAAKTPVLWHAQSGKLSYWDAENRARLTQKVMVQAPDQKMSGEQLDLYFTRANDAGPAITAQGAPPAALGAQQIGRAVATGGVTVVQGDRRATAERGEYTAADGKFVMTGGTPTIFDASEGSTTGRQLTFFLADATIIVDSENGSRTLTKHRVEK
jgi:lipopolysaccharide export system protein LptA